MKNKLQAMRSQRAWVLSRRKYWISGATRMAWLNHGK